MPLQSGRYWILFDGAHVGRSRSETKDLMPKQIFASTDDPRPIWDVQALPDGTYILSTRGAPTGTANGSWVVALLMNQEYRETWIIKPAGDYSGDGYIIRRKHYDLVWTVTQPGGRSPIEGEPEEEGDPNQIFTIIHA